MKTSIGNNKARAIIAIIVAVGALLLAAILFTGKKTSENGEGGTAPSERAEGSDKRGADGASKEHGAGDTHSAEKKGEHGGQLFISGRLRAELLLAEQNGEARHQLWVSENGKMLAPATIVATATLARPQGDVQEYSFAAQGDSLVSTATIAEPHVFAATIIVKRGKDVMQLKMDSEEGKVELSDAQIKGAGISTPVSGPARIRSVFQLAGEVRFNEDRTAHIVPRLAGVVESVTANLGQQVKKGQVLAVIASAEVSELRSALLSAQRRQALAQVTYEREKKLWLEKISAQQDYLQAQQAYREAEIETQNARQKLAAIGASASSGSGLNRYELRAPFDGAIVEKHIALGESVKEDANVFTISDLSTVWAEIIVPAKDLGTVRVGAPATVKATSMDSVATGKVAYVGSLLGEQTRTAKARVTLANPNNAWRPGLFVNVELTADERDAAVAVLSDAIQAVDGRSTVFVKVEGGFIPQAVTIGRSDRKYTEILAGLKAGISYAASGSFVVKAEQGKGSAEHAH